MQSTGLASTVEIPPIITGDYARFDVLLFRRVVADTVAIAGNLQCVWTTPRKQFDLAFARPNVNWRIQPAGGGFSI